MTRSYKICWMRSRPTVVYKAKGNAYLLCFFNVLLLYKCICFDARQRMCFNTGLHNILKTFSNEH